MSNPQTNDDKNPIYTKFASGIVIIRSENSNFNADFTHTPRRLPDENGTIYATDKSLKYCIRKYLKDNVKDGKIFVWRRKNVTDQPMDVIENYNKLFDKKPTDHTKPEIISNLLKCIDIRLFGITFAPKKEKSKQKKKEDGESDLNKEQKDSDSKNISIVGSVQISYGMDKFGKNIHYTNQISSPYRDTTDAKAQQTTIGEESKALESHYVFDFILNSNHLKDGVEHLLDNDNKNNIQLLTEKDINSFKEAARMGVTNVNSTTKIGSENELLLFIEYDKPILLQNLKSFVNIKDVDGGVKREVDMTNLKNYLISIAKALINNDVKTQKTVNVEIYYDPEKTDIKGFLTSEENLTISKKHLITGNEIPEKNKNANK